MPRPPTTSHKSGDDDDLAQESDPGASLATLPYDMAEAVFSYLGLPDVLSMAKVSKSFHEVATGSRLVWNNLSFDLLRRSRPLPLRGFQLPAELGAHDLRRYVLKATFLEHNWATPNPRTVVPPKVLKLSLPTPEEINRIWRITSNYVLLATERGSIICWNIEHNCCAGKHELGQGWVVFNCRADYMSKQVFCIAGEYPESEGPMTLMLLRIQFEEKPDECEKAVTFQALVKFTIPHSHVLDLFILDLARRFVCVLFLTPETNTVGMYALLDWESGLNALMDTNIPYLHRKVTATSLSQDGKDILIHIEAWESEIRLSFSVAEFASRASRRPRRALTSPPTLTAEHTLVWPDQQGLPSEHMMPMGSYFFRQWWPSYPNIPIRFSTALVFNRPGTPIWRLAQHYSSPEGPCTNQRFVATITDPVLVPHDMEMFIQPLLDVDFSHAVWIEWTGDEAKRMRLATFPSPESIEGFDSPDVAVKTLDVPSEVLDVAQHLVIDQSQGSIMISSFSGDFHIYQYA